MSLNDQVVKTGETAGWSTSIGLLGIHAPKCVAVFEFEGSQYNTVTEYVEFKW